MSYFKIAGTALLMYSLRVSRRWNDRGQSRHLGAMVRRAINLRGTSLTPPAVRAKRKTVRAYTGRTLNGIHNRRVCRADRGGYRIIPSGYPESGLPVRNKRVVQ